MTSPIETIKAKVDVAEEIGLVVSLHKSGKSLKGLCPLHSERTPSFYVYPESQTWHCFGCNEGGDIFTFVEKQQGLDFREALHYLAEKAGVALEDAPNYNSEEERENSALKERLRKLNEDALLWFHQMLLRSKEAGEARAYVQSRGISADTVISFGLGYAPASWDSLSRYLLSQGYTERELVTGGLARQREEKGLVEANEGDEEKGNGIYDYFRNRLLFPIRDSRSRVIGFGGRALDDSKPKYLNSPQTPLFEKSSVLYAIDMARDAIKQANQVVIVEGYVDAVIAHQYGTKQTVACIGSAITEKHIQQLKKLTKQVTLALDPDAAGSAATEHGIQEALKTFDSTVVPVPTEGRRFGKGNQRYHGVILLEEQVDAEINVLQLPLGEDPDEVIRNDFSGWLYALSHPISLIDYFFSAKTADLDLQQSRDRAEAAKRLLPILGMIHSSTKRDDYVQKLARLLRVDARSLYEDLRGMMKRQPQTSIPAKFSDSAKGPIKTTKWQESEEFRNSQGEESHKQGSNVTNSTVSFVSIDKSRDSKIQWEDYLIGLLLRNPGLSQYVCGIINDGDFAGTDTRELYRILNSLYQRGSSPSYQSLEQFVPSVLRTAVARAQQSVELRSPLDGAGQVKAAVQCATRLKRTRLIQLNTELQYLLDEAVDSGDTAGVRQLQQRLMEIYQQVRTIDSATHLQG